MNIEGSIANLFPVLKDIPKKLRPPGKINQKQYLVNGELREWTGIHHDWL